jgi:hypothetical protein
MADFDLSGGLLNFSNRMFGGGGGYDDLLTEEQRKRIAGDSLTSMAAALLKAGGPSTQRIGLGQALGSALEAGAGAAEKGQMNAVQQILMRQKIDEMKRAQALQGSIAGILTGATPQGPSAATQELAPTEGMTAGPTLERAAMMDNIKPPSAEEIKASKYLQIADVYAAQGRPEEAQKYQTMAEKFNPRPEVVGQPFEVSSSDGKPILVQQYKNGTIKTMEGYGPKRDVVLQNLGGQTVAIDKSKLTGKETFTQTMTPGEVASNQVALGNLAVNRGQLGVAQGGLGLRQQEFARGAYDLVDSPEGRMYVPKMPGGAALPAMTAEGKPVMGTSGGNPTEAQSNAIGFAQRMERTTGILAPLEAAGSFPATGSAIAGSTPLIGGTMRRAVQSPDVQKYDQAAQDWIRAKLRKESGAAIGKEESANEYATYFPMPQDSPEVIAQKAAARDVATQAMRESAGKFYKPYTAPAPQAAPAQKKMVYKNGVFVFE